MRTLSSCSLPALDELGIRIHDQPKSSDLLVLPLFITNSEDLLLLVHEKDILNLLVWMERT